MSLNFLVVLSLAMALLAFTSIREGGMKGMIAPAESAGQVMAIAGSDTLKANVAAGRFTLTNVKKGTYALWIKARPPYKDTLIRDVAVIDSAVTDVGVIKLKQ